MTANQTLGACATACATENGTSVWLRKVEQITFSGKGAAMHDQPVLYITECAVFSLGNGERTLIEVAPRINMEKAALDQLDCELKQMRAELVQPTWSGLRAIIESKIIESKKIGTAQTATDAAEPVLPGSEV